VISKAITKADTPYNHSIEGENTYGRGYCDGLAVALYIISTNQKKAQPFYPPKEYTENKEKWEKEKRKKEMEKKKGIRRRNRR
jgi:hypothetical protein